MLPRLFRREHNHKTTKSQVSEGLHATPTAIGTQEPSSPMMDLKHKHKHRKPKLERRNAIKNIDYDASSSPDSSLRTRSLDLPTTSSYGGQTSFRVEGIDVGEFDRICRNLGLSGPEDFAIPAADWEKRKTRSSSNLFPRSRLRDGDGDGDGELDDDEPSSTAPAILLSSTLSDSSLLLAGVIRDAPSHENGAITSGNPGFTRISSYPSQAECQFQTKTELTGGIKGPRPPVLAPPPAMSLPVLNKMFSTWDIVRSFAPDEDEANGIFGLENNGGVVPSAILEGRYSCQDVEEEEEEEKEEEDGDDDDEDGAVEENGRGDDRLGETDLTGSSTFSTSNDDDSSSTTTEPMFVISPNGRFKRHIKSWIRGGILGSGSFGTVYEGISDDGFFFAVKEVSLLDQGSRAQQCILQLEQEIALLSQFEHENIVQYFGTDKEEAKLYIFLELVTQGSLSSLYQKYHLRDSQVSAYTRQILHGLKYLHDRNVMHRDIKCANILVDASGSVKLADFGLAKETSKLNRLKSCKGSAYWMAPEVVNPRKTYSLAADIWSLGCSVLEMLTRQLPYSDLEWTQALFKIGRGEAPHIPNALSRDARDFIQQCLQVDPEDRPSASKLVDHPFVKRPLSDRRLPKPS